LRYSFFGLSTAATLVLTIAWPIRELRAEHGSTTAAAFVPSDVKATECTAGTMLPGRAKRTVSLFAELWTQLRAFAQYLGPDHAAEDMVQEALARALAAGALGTVSIGSLLCVASRRRRRGEERRCPAAPNLATRAPTDAPPAAGEAAVDPAEPDEEQWLLALGNHLRSIVRNVAREQWRRAKRGRTIAPEVADGAIAATPSPAAAAIDDETATEVQRLLDRLSVREREVVLRHTQFDQTFPQIAVQMGIGAAAATKCWQRVVRRMRTDPRWQALADA
jgi:DNA-directed RNA polymerase specialized sigma24 family protein